MSAFTPKGEASLRGHLKNDSAPEAKGSISYVPKEKEKDVQLKAAIDLLHGKKIETSKKLENAAAPASAESAEVPN
jgi:carboxyl-terminal processing protease